MTEIRLPTLGVPRIDEDHQAAADLIIRARAAADAEIPALVETLEAHCREHFGREEALMAASAFFATHCHQAEHQRVLAEAAAAVAAARDGRIDEARRYVCETFPAWLKEHAQTMDMVTMHHVRASGVAVAA